MHDGAPQDGLLPESLFSDPESTTTIPPLLMLRSGLSISWSLSCPGGYPVCTTVRRGQTQLCQYPERKRYQRAPTVRRWWPENMERKSGVQAVSSSSSSSAPGWHLSPPPNHPGDGLERPCMTNRITGSQVVSSKLLTSHPEAQLGPFSYPTFLHST